MEAARSNLVLVDAHGELVTPPADRGLVAGIAREVVSERVPELKERDVRSDDVLAAREILAINSVRGARPIVELDGGPVGRADGPGLARLQGALAYD